MSLRFVENLWRRWRSTGSYEALAHGGGNKRVLAECETIIRAEIAKQPEITLEQLCDKVALAKGLKASKSMMCREVKRLNLPLKKVTPRRTNRERESNRNKSRFPSQGA
ncbi:MAG: hypothetical protein AB1489_28470 [Acidobacteriota bacterium]